ncbi:hypothetical protein EJ04DRAFT_513229 [Polyplosphaeria fusca]|uniref:G-patch domain-containing protein n=1 Tax=Polyplosphaeria fusca TaxID=682080 RepID=A0A9P4QYJ8_9PLEO|nr:hypothetical protein EJ04DRAFT_513229 [Polyplosphaeria fusca]
MSFKRKRGQDGDEPAPKPKGLSFAQRMMQKMGHKEGEGLGREGQGMTAPIDVVMREKNAGLGSAPEKSRQAKEEERRQKKMRGEEFSDSEEESRKKHKKRQGKPSASSTPRPRKPRYQTIDDIESTGLKLPETLVTLDMTGGKLLTNSLSQEDKLAGRIRAELGSFAEASHALQNDRLELDQRESELQFELQNLELHITKSKDFRAELQTLCEIGDLVELIDKLQDLNDEYSSRLNESIMVAAIKGHVESAEDLADLLVQLKRLPTYQGQRSTRKTSPLGSLIHSSVLPKLQRMITSWDVEEPFEMAHLMSLASAVFPPFAEEQSKRLVAMKIQTALKGLSYRAFGKEKVASWIVPWLDILPPVVCTEILSTVKSNLRLLLSKQDLAKGPPASLELWRRHLDIDSLLLSNTVPRIAQLLRETFVIDPSDQQMDEWLVAQKWAPLIGPRVFTELLSTVFMPKFLDTLRVWLSADPDYSEISGWYQFWEEQISSTGVDTSTVLAPALTYIDRASDGNGQAPPDVEDFMAQPREANMEEAAPGPTTADEPTFRDIIEAWCAEEDLLLVALREAHQATGLPLFRITASASGKGGVAVYLKGDLIYAQDKKNKNVWEPVALDDSLIQRAAGK